MRAHTTSKLEAAQAALAKLVKVAPSPLHESKALHEARSAFEATVQARVDRHNEHDAIRSNDLINVNEKTRVRERGRGAYRNWLPSAIQRVCWGFRRRLTKKGLASMTAPSVSSARTSAGFHEGNHSHVQDIRDATAHHFLDLQITELDRNSKCSLMLIEFAFDETETPTRLTVAN